MLEMRKTLCSSIYDGKTEVGRVKYLIIDSSFLENYPEYDFLVSDMAHIIIHGMVNRIIYITEVYVNKEYRMQYYGQELVHTLTDQFSDSAIILRAGALIEEYPEEPKDEELNIIILRLISFFNKCGFVSINEYCGFENSEAMLFIGNDIGRDVFYDLLVTGSFTKRTLPKLNTESPKYTWKDIVEINGNIYAEEFPISGKMDGHAYQIDDFLGSVAEKYGIDADNIKTYMMDNIDFDASSLPFGAEDCGCYINGHPEWLLKKTED